MADPYLEKFADLLVEHSLAEVDFKREFEEGQKILLIDYEPAAEDLARLVAERVWGKGGHVRLERDLPWEARSFYNHAKGHVLDALPTRALEAAKYLAARLMICAPSNTKEMAKVNQEKKKRVGKANKPLDDVLYAVNHEESIKRGVPVLHIPWILTAYPTDAYAQDFGTDIDTYKEFLWDVLLLNESNPAKAWREMGKYQTELIKNVLSKVSTVALYASDGTHLEMKVKDEQRTHLWLPCYGTVNLPDGEIYNGPIRDTVNGVIKFPVLPQAYSGGPDVTGIEIHFENGRVVDYKAERGQDYLDEFFKEETNRYLGEIALGLNPKITKMTREILFDEKMGGAIHIAFGDSYEDTVLDPNADRSGLNQSETGDHWDMIKRMWHEDGGYVLLDDRYKLTWDKDAGIWDVDDTKPDIIEPVIVLPH